MKDSERMLISAHEDGEVGAPWNAELDRRIASDPEWGAEAEAQRAVKAALAASPEPDFAEARLRVAARLAAVSARPRTNRFVPTAWISVAAAALLLAAGATGFWMGRQSAGAAPGTDLAELQVKMPRQLGLKLTGEGQLLAASTTERAAP